MLMISLIFFLHCSGHVVQSSCWCDTNGTHQPSNTFLDAVTGPVSLEESFSAVWLVIPRQESCRVLFETLVTIVTRTSRCRLQFDMWRVVRAAIESGKYDYRHCFPQVQYVVRASDSSM